MNSGQRSSLAAKKLSQYKKNFNVVFLRHAESVNNILSKDITSNNFELNRHPDAPLTDRGVAQVTAAGKAIVQKKFDPTPEYVLTSYFHRALRTAKAVEDAFKEEVGKQQTEAKNSSSAASQLIAPIVQVWRDIHEFGGSYKSKPKDESNPDDGALVEVPLPGRTRGEVEKEFPSFTFRDDDRCENGWWIGHQGKEDRAHLRLRAISMYSDFCTRIGQKKKGSKEEEDATVVVVTHGYLYAALMKEWQAHGWLTVKEGENVELISNTAMTHLRFSLDEETTVAMMGDDEEAVEAVEGDEQQQEEEGGETVREMMMKMPPPYKVALVFQNDTQHLSEIGCEDPQSLKVNFSTQ